MTIDFHNPGWLADRVADTGRRWDCDDARVNATLWWYSASHHLVQRTMAQLLRGGPAHLPDVHRIALAPNGYIDHLDEAEDVADAAELGVALHALASPCIDGLTQVGGATRNALWSIQSDSLASAAPRALRQAGESPSSGPETLEAGAALADAVVSAFNAASPTGGPRMPAPRYWSVSVHGFEPLACDRAPARGSVRVTRRNSCCLLVKTPVREGRADNMCSTCPRQRPAVRHKRLLDAAGLIEERD